MNENVLVSIITPCYNASKYIGTAIQSVQLQTYGNWEMIIVDDCSIDDSYEIISSYAKRDKRIRCYRMESNSGSPAAPRNRALQLSRGEVIAMLDADDIWYSSKLSEQLECMRRHNCAIVYSNGNIINENGDLIKSMKKLPISDYNITLYRFELSSSSVIFKKKLLQNELFEKTDKEDLVFWLKLLRKTGEVAYNSNKLHYAYRILPNSRSRNKAKIVVAQWKVYRKKERLCLIKSVLCICKYIYGNVKKYV